VRAGAGLCWYVRARAPACSHVSACRFIVLVDVEQPDQIVCRLAQQLQRVPVGQLCTSAWA
jgi:hypothetical protein